MKKYNIPVRKYVDDKKKKMVSMRVSQALWEKIESLAQEKGWQVTELVTTVLDQYAQFEEKHERD